MLCAGLAGLSTPCDYARNGSNFFRMRGIRRWRNFRFRAGTNNPAFTDHRHKNSMSEASNKRSEEFLKISGQFKLGALVTESSHPVTANLSEVAKKDIAQALDLLFQV